MLGSTALLTLVTLAGLVAGFGREWLLVANWGAGARSDAFLVAMFLPEALRTMLAGGVLAAAGLPLWQTIAEKRRAGWLAAQSRHWLAVSLLLSGGIWLLAPALVRLIGPGLDAAGSHAAAISLRWLALCLPGLLLHALFSIPLQAQGRYLRFGLGSLLFNLPAVGYLWLAGKHSQPQFLAQSFVLGSLLMLLPLLPAIWHQGWRPWGAGQGDAAQLWRKLWPLLASSGASQGLALLERLVASLLGEGAITLVNLARKLVNIPLIALMSLNQVLLGKMSGEDSAARKQSLRRGLQLCTLLTLPATTALIAGAHALVQLLLPAELANGPLPVLLALFALSIVVGSWNALLARYFYAGADTITPLYCELRGNGVQALLLLSLPLLLGIWGIAAATLGGVLSGAWLLARRQEPALLARLVRLAGYGVLLCVGTIPILLWRPQADWPQLAAAAGYGLMSLLILLAIQRRDC